MHGQIQDAGKGQLCIVASFHPRLGLKGCVLLLDAGLACPSVGDVELTNQPPERTDEVGQGMPSLDMQASAAMRSGCADFIPKVAGKDLFAS